MGSLFAFRGSIWALVFPHCETASICASVADLQKQGFMPPKDDFSPLLPERCQTMAEVRAGVDAIDQELARLLGVRFGYMRAAARIKPERSHVRDEARKAEVIRNAVAAARAAQWPEACAEQLWEQLVEASIAYELEAFDALNGPISSR